MKKLAILAVLALELAVCGCGTTPKTTVITTTSGNWEAQLLGGSGSTAQLNFVTSFSVTSTTGGTSQPLDITGFGFFNAGECFALGETAETESGSATLNTNSSGQVTGGLTYTVNSATNSGNVLTLTSTNLTGTSNGTTTTTGTLSNGIAVGTWTLVSSDPKCNNQNAGNTFIMCQGTATCTPP